MPSLVIPDTVRVTLVWALTGVEYMVNVIHYIVPSGQTVSGATATDIGSDIEAAFSASSYDTLMSDEVNLARITVRDLRSANQPEYSDSSTSTGLSTQAVLPLQVALVATLRTALAGRSYRGRFYGGGWSEEANDPTGTASSAAATGLTSFLTGISGPTVQGNLWALAVASPTLLESNAVTSVDVRDLTWDTQRRRSYPGI